ncbi:hypothetical protein GCM10011321_04660 [Youhaiella tibetensis]|uniref:Uncharacterized protein n=1 Tax=Paradevosia tibetensis TaxID=1447062 RepID=A0A5B9DQ85_9HYPH|nr:hypothetical protein [Youhaiella tibetensis]QEE21343.1 hypothetical protein FNA67_14610 [Youhaiella tibetensis]GGF15856.1 hypothetical protein GCM10011321_04660 [Youhaiella tibetensis]
MAADPNVFNAATEFGRLDYLSALMALIALLIALLAFPFFNFLKYRAEQVAAGAAREELEKAVRRLEQDAVNRMEAMLPSLVRDYMELARAVTVTDQEANEIAAAQGTDQDDASRDDS